MTRPLVRVIKVGGSLLDWPELPERLWQWLELQPPATNHLLAGGGKFADAVRCYDAALRLGEERSHQLCLDVLRTSMKLLSDMLTIGRRRHQGESRQEILMLDAATQLVAIEDALPHTWAVTTDSIAAYFAEQLAADELVLLKSAPLVGDHTTQSAADAGYVDAYFPIATWRLHSIWVVNLRDEATPKWRLS